jgi:aminoglycoside phosphotransferase (APT) family kinase protein
MQYYSGRRPSRLARPEEAARAPQGDGDIDVLTNMTEIDATLVKQLIRAQFPQWAELPITPVENGGWDNRTFHLGDSMSVRLPSASHYVAQIEKEHRWLPVLGAQLPLPIPIPLARGAPGAGYPWPWSIYGWLDGTPARADRIQDLGHFAEDLARFLVALRKIDASNGPVAGTHNFHRGGSLTVYDTETRGAIVKLADEIDAGAATEVWNTALTTSWHGPSVWVHGDVAASNLLVSDERLCAVIDFGCAGVGDPSCDLVIAWTFLDEASRKMARSTIGLDPETWQRARGWAIWKALITLSGIVTTTRARPRRRSRASATSLTIISDPNGKGSDHLRVICNVAAADNLPASFQAEPPRPIIARDSNSFARVLRTRTNAHRARARMQAA